MTEETPKSIFWMAGMIFAYELLISFLVLVAFVMIFLITLSLVVEEIEINGDIFSAITIILFALSYLASLFGQIFGIWYGVSYVLSKTLIQSNTVRKIIWWYMTMHFILFFIFFFSQGSILQLLLFILPVITGPFLIWYFFKNAIGAIKS